MRKVSVGHRAKQRQKNPHKLPIYGRMATDSGTQELEYYLPVRNKDGHFGLSFNTNSKTTAFNQ